MAQTTDSPSAAPHDRPDRLNDLRFADFLQEIVACFDPQLRHTYVNSAVELFTGLPARDFIGKTNRDLGMPKEQVDQWDRVLSEVFRSGKSSQLQFSFDTPGGTRLFHSTLTPQTNLHGEVTSVVTIARDVSASPLAGLTAGLFKAIIDSSDDAIISKTLDGMVTSWNRGAEMIFGYSQAEMLGRPLVILFPPERQHEEIFIQERLLQGDKVEHFETIRIRKNGEPVHVSVTISPIRDVDGKIIGASKVARDITERKRIEADLIAALAFAENANQAKSDFVSRMSHELRSPLNAVLGFAQLLQSGEPPPTELQEKNVGQILKAGWYLLGLIDEMLDLSKMETGHLSCVLEPVLLAEVLNDCLAMVEGHAQARGIRLHFPQNEDRWIATVDRTRFKQVFTNLLSNAIKYNRKGGTVQVRCEAAGQGRVCIRIADNGIGLRPDQLADIFKPFERLGQEEGSIEGTGIGLALSKGLVELMGGRIGVESVVDQGSVFWVELEAPIT
jgi:PAS domain S-box-containing protein